MTQLSFDLAHAHHNRQLFSNHFLEQRLRVEDLWAEVGDEAEEVRSRLRALYEEREASLHDCNEAQTEESWIRPVLDALGWGFIVQPRSQRQGTTRFPDYALFADAVSARAAASAEGHRHVLKEALGVLEAKRWERGLDALGGATDSVPNRAPSLQIINYLYRSEQPWGILTNGREWRLYHRDADFADTVYFAVDLPALLSDADLPLGEEGHTIAAAEAFRYFYLFFRPEAFTLEAYGERWLDRAKQWSIRYARAVEEALKPRAYRAVTALCRGFAAGAELSPAEVAENQELGRTVLDNALTVLFRMLFVLYAESRELLPVRTNSAYRNKSFVQLRDRAARIRDGEDATFPKGRDLWSDLTDLFAIIDGDAAWRGVGVPVYNGGLFDPDKHPWIEEHYVPDPFLAEAVDLLSRAEDPETRGLHHVDYAPLDVRHLGSIYEGLLEHVLRRADDELPAVTEKGQRIRDPVPTGELYLANDKGERKVSGSYYTPDYVVQYIIERTLGPLVEGKSVAGILELKVLDPAMGSGHFLVAATSYLARQAVSAAEEGDQRILGDFASLDPEHLRRLVVERCIFGVDKNPRAVELAKLALWIATVQKDKPLNFLDHHLKRGDSLLGTRLRDLGTLPAGTGKAGALEELGQVGLFEDAFRQQVFKIVAFIQSIERLPSETVQDIERKEELYRRADAMLERFRLVADVWTSTLFGNALDADAYDRAVERLRGPREKWDEVAQEEWAGCARDLWREHHFFHWDLEFAEVFFGDQGGDLESPGFDAVVGNPPYVRMEEFKELKGFLRARYETYDTRTDLYVYFIERSLDVLRDGGQYGAILSNKFLRANYGKKVRALIGREAAVREIVDFGGLPVFPEATVRSAIFVAQKGALPLTPMLAEIQNLEFADLPKAVAGAAVEIDPAGVKGETWSLVDAQMAKLLEKLGANAATFGEHYDICRGIVTGLNAAFIIDGATRDQLVDSDPSSVEVVKPLIVGGEIRRYHLERTEQWLLYVPHGIDISAYPAVRTYLERFKDRLEERATDQEWYELQQPQMAYRAFFEGPKILYPVIAPESRFAFTQLPLFPNDKCFLIPAEKSSLVAILNSSVMEFYLLNVLAKLEGGSTSSKYLEFRAQYMERLPIRRIQERTTERGRRELGSWLQALYYRGLKRAGLEPEVPEDIRALGPRLGAVEGVERVLLIGSWARGHAHEESDVDLVVIDRGDGDRTERYIELRRRLRPQARSIDLLVYSPEEVERGLGTRASFLGHVIPEAVEIYAES